jgi:hydrogenase maturation factor HypF (carbamoyltransferase family)
MGCLWSAAHLPHLPADADLALFDGPFEVVTSDASGLGGGAWWGHERLHHTFTAEERAGAFSSSNMRELAMAPVGARRWAAAWCDRRVLWRFDNQAAVGAVNKRASMSPHFNALILDMLAITVPRGIEVLARYIPGELNTLADGISRLRGARDDHDW